MHKFLKYHPAEVLVKHWVSGMGFDLQMGKVTGKNNYAVKLKFPTWNGAGCFCNRTE